MAGAVPVPRAGHTLACVGGRNLLFGGFGCKEGIIQTIYAKPEYFY